MCSYQGSTPLQNEQQLLCRVNRDVYLTECSKCLLCAYITRLLSFVKALDRFTDCFVEQIISDHLQTVTFSNVLELHIQLFESFEHALTHVIIADLNKIKSGLFCS